MPHADSSLVPPEIISKEDFWFHVLDQLQNLLADQRDWVTNLANASSLIYHTLLVFDPHFGSGVRAVNWCVAMSLVRLVPADDVIIGFYLIPSLFPKPHFTKLPSRDQRAATVDENKLLLGPFCGKPACQFINVSQGRAKGVCADAFLQRKSVIVPNVDQYPGHIACDGDTKSEIVCPLVLQNGDVDDPVVLGVLDLDCLALGGFDEHDRLGLEAIVDLIVKRCDW